MTDSLDLRPPFPWFGGKWRVAPLVWRRFGGVRNYVEPFFGSGAVLLGRPQPFDGVETVNDRDGLVANFWRALQRDPDAVASHADNPVNENDLHARHAWLVARLPSLAPQLEGDPDYCDAKVAGWWVWGLACWIGGGFCSGKGPWQPAEVDGVRQLVRLGDAGRGVNRQLVHLGNAGCGVNRQLVRLGDAGRGVNRRRVHLGNAGRGVNRQRVELLAYFRGLADRLRDVRVCCGDWTRVMGETPMLVRNGTFTPVGVFLDPPYADTAGRQPDLYRVDSDAVAHAAREWALSRGDDPRYRIALCGYDGEHEMPASWECVEGKGGRGHGYGGQKREGYANARRERIWFSPHCQRPGDNAGPLFAGLGGEDDEDELEGTPP